MERTRSQWLRWLMLVVAAGSCWSIWQKVDLYHRLAAGEIFSPEILEEIGWEFWISCATRGALALIFFYQGIFWRQKKTARYALRDGVFLSALTLLWVLCCLLAPWERGTWEKKEWLPWLLLLLAMAGGAAFSWRQYFCRRRSEAAAAPEEGGFAPAAKGMAELGGKKTETDDQTLS